MQLFRTVMNARGTGREIFFQAGLDQIIRGEKIVAGLERGTCGTLCRSSACRSTLT
jgi:hypothetical protein